jgi:hypothetical protein
MEKKKNVKKNKDESQLKWIIGIVILVFVLVFGIYFYVQSLRFFTYANVDWAVEKYEDLVIYHGRFPAFYNSNVTYNLFLRNDPRKNNVSVIGNLSDFRYGEILAFTPEADECRGELPRVIVDLAAFLKAGMGIKSIEPGSTDWNISKETNRTFADCFVYNRGVIIIQKGNESLIEQSPKNPFCYMITVKDCEDNLAVEKFILEIIKEKNKYR